MDRRRNDILAALETHGPSLHALLLRLTLRYDAAEDLMQELFLRLAGSKAFAAADDPAAYAARTAINLAMDWRRRRLRDRRRVPMPTDLAGATPSPAAALEAAEQTQAVLDALSRLDELGRQVLVMRHVQQESYETIARLLGKDVHRVRPIANKAMTRLRRRLGIRAGSETEMHSEGQ